METQEEIELINPWEIQAKEKDNFEYNYYTLVSSIKSFIEAETTATTQEVEQKTIPRTFMAPVPMPKFNGDPTKWLNFKKNL